MKRMVFCLIWTIISSSLSFSQEGYIFPLKENREFSSIFADHRSFHFHSGIDFKTGEKTGLEVYAAKSGWVYRLFASWWGYGKAVYLKHPDGQLTLYAHLSDFSEKLKKIVTGEQLRNKRYRADILPQDTIRIEQGELIGYSGETGTGEPHFHFEIRDEKNRPLNPLTSGLSIPDTIPPVFASIGIKPLDLNSYVDDSADIKIYPLHFDSRQQVYTSTKIPIVEGRIGIEISAYDQMAEK
jgi:murein DD-endopeptidase MepM/ murein hydrolase activator NlpD